MFKIVRESKSAIASLYIPPAAAIDEIKLKEHLNNLAREYNNGSLCFWMKLPAGCLRAYFWTTNGIETRTYTSMEVTDALFHKKALFFHSAEAILNQLEEPMLAAA